MRGVLVLVEASEHSSLRALVRAFASAGRPLHLVLDVAALSEVPVGEAVVLCIRPEDAAWLNRQRPRFAHRRLRVFLWASSSTAGELRERAPDFFDWISHHQEVPPALPGFVRNAVELPVPGLLFAGTTADAATLLARCGIATAPTTIDGQQHFTTLVDELRAASAGWRIVDGIDGAFWVRRARWALADAHTRARTIFSGAASHSPGWLPWSALTLDLWAATAQLTAAGVADAAAVAVACELEPAAVALACWLAQCGGWDSAVHSALTAADVGTALSALAATRGDLPPALRSSAPFIRALAAIPTLRPRDATYKRALQRGHTCDPEILATVTARAAWTRPEPLDDAPPVLRGWHIEALLRGGWRSARAYLAYARVAGALGHTDAQMTWVLRGYAAPQAEKVEGALLEEFEAAVDAADDLHLFGVVLLNLLADVRVRQELGVEIGVHLRLVLAEEQIDRQQFSEAEILLQEALAAAHGQAELEADVYDILAELAELRGDTAAATAWTTLRSAVRPDVDPGELASAEERAAGRLDRGDWSGAEAEARAGLAELSERDPPVRKTNLLDQLATALEEQDRLADAAEAFVALRDHLRAHGAARGRTAFSTDATLASLWIRLGRLDEAGALLQERGPELVRLFGEDHLLGVLFDIDAVELALARGDWVAAEAVARRLVELTHRVRGPAAGEHLHAQALLGRALLGQGRSADALVPLRLVHAGLSALWSDDPEVAVAALTDLARALQQHGEAEQSLAVLRELHARVRALPTAERQRHLFHVVLSLENHLTMHGRMSEAVDVYLQAIADDPSHRRAYLLIGEFAFMHSDRGPQWEAMMRDELTRTRPGDRDWRLQAYRALAVHYRQRQRWPEAETVLRASLALQTATDPQYAHTMVDLYSHFRQLGRLPNAVAILRELLKHPLPWTMHFGDPTYLRGELADLLLLGKDYPAAEIVAADPKLAGPRMFALFKQGKDTELSLCARAVLDDSVAGRPGDAAHARFYLAVLDLRRGNVDAVMASLKEITTGAGPDDSAVQGASAVLFMIAAFRRVLSPGQLADVVRETMEYQLKPPRR